MFKVIIFIILNFLIIGCESKSNSIESSESPVLQKEQTISFQEMGPGISGGGDAVLCYDHSGEVQSAQLFDLFEGEVLYNNNYDEERSRQLSVDEWIEIFVNRTSKIAFRDFFKNNFHLIQDGLTFIEGSRLKEVNDEASTIMPPIGCETVQLARYLSSTKINIQKEVWDRLNTFDQAALIIHETFYSMERLLNKTPNSRYSRYLTSFLVADERENEIGVDLNVIPPIICEGSTEPLFSEYGIFNSEMTSARKIGRRSGETLFYINKADPVKSINGVSTHMGEDTIEVSFILLNGHLAIKPFTSYLKDKWSDYQKIMDTSEKYFDEKSELLWDLGSFAIDYKSLSVNGQSYGSIEFNGGIEDSQFPLVNMGDKIFFKCSSTEGKF